MLKFIKNVIRNQHVSADYPTNRGVENTSMRSATKAIAFFTDLGINIVDEGFETTEGGITIHLSEGDTRILSPFEYEINVFKLVMAYHVIKTTGLSGRLIIQAFTDAIIELDETYDIIKNQKGDIFVKEFASYMKQILKIHGLPYKTPTFKTANTIYVSLGGYKNIKRIFMEAFEKVANNNVACFHACNICKYYKMDNHNNSYCDYILNKIPDGLTTEELGRYKEIKVHDGVLYSKWIIDTNKEMCRYFKDRRPIK